MKLFKKYAAMVLSALLSVGGLAVVAGVSMNENIASSQIDATDSTWSATLSSATKFAGTNPASLTIDNITLTVSGTSSAGGTPGSVDSTKGQQFGTGSKPFSALSFSTSGFSGKTISSITVNASTASSAKATMSVSVGSTSFKSDANETVSLTSSSADYAFSGSASGEITVSYSQTTSKALYLKSISVTYSEGSGETPVVSGVAVSGDSSISEGMKRKATVQCSAEVSYSTTTKGSTSVTWSVAPESVATISATGLVTFIDNGTATVTATSVRDAAKKGTKTITASGLTDGGKFEKIQNELYLNDGDVVAFIGEKTTDRTYYTMGSTIGNNIPAVEVTRNSDDSVYESYLYKTFTVGKTTESGVSYYSFLDNETNQYLYAADAGADRNNYLKEQETNDDYGLFSASFSKGEVTLSAKGANKRNILSFNSGSSLFSCYTSYNSPTYLYKVMDESAHIVTISAAKTEVQVNSTITLTASCSNASCAINNESWESSDGTVATVAGGVVTGVNPGTSKIKVSCDGGFFDEIEITVFAKTGSGTEADPYTATGAKKATLALADGAETEESYYVVGTVSRAYNNKYSAVNATAGTASFYISDGSEEFLVYQVTSIDGKAPAKPDDLIPGDIVKAYGKLKKYGSSTVEMVDGTVTITEKISVTSLVVTEEATKTEWNIGDKWTPSNAGMTLKAVYSGGEIANIGNFCQVNGGESVALEVGENSITLSLRGKTVGLTVIASPESSVSDNINWNNKNSYTTSEVVWELDAATVKFEKNTDSATDFNDSYTAPMRFYVNWKMTVTPKDGYQVSKIAIKTSSASYTGNGTQTNCTKSDNETDLIATFTATDPTSAFSAVFSSTRLYMYSAEVVYETTTAALWAADFLNLSSSPCGSGQGATSASLELKTFWNKMAVAYGKLSEDEKNSIREAVASEEGTDIEKAMARYEYIINKYGAESFANFGGNYLNRPVSSSPSIGNKALISDDSMMASMIAVVGFGAAIAGLYLFLKRKHA